MNTHSTEFRVVLDCAEDPRNPFDGLLPLPLPIAGTIESSLDALKASALHQAQIYGLPVTADEYEELRNARPLFASLLSIALYLCSINADIARREAPSDRNARKKGSRWRYVQQPQQPPSRPVEWDVGVRIGAALRQSVSRQSDEHGSGTGRHVRPHVRRAHWHSYWVGPRNGDRRRELRWLPPIPVGIEDFDKLPATIRRVGDRS